MCPNPGVLRAPDFSLTFPPDPAWVRTCRETVRTSARTLGRGAELIELAMLLMSESVSNAITACADSGCPDPITLHGEWGGLPCGRDGRRHVRGAGKAGAAAEAGPFRIHVRDGAPGLPVVRAAQPTDEDGRGMQLIANCAARWGVCADGPGPGKSVWFQLGRAW
jgi:hypothetical protein